MVGFASFNEKYIYYNNGAYKYNISFILHKFMNTMFFHPWLFENVYPSHNGETFIFEDVNDGIYKLRGSNILSAIREHFACPSAVGGKTIQ